MIPTDEERAKAYRLGIEAKSIYDNPYKPTSEFEEILARAFVDGYVSKLREQK